MNYPIEDFIINFLARKESPEDVQKLKEWLVVDPARRNKLKQWLAVWDSVGMVDATDQLDIEKAYQRFLFRVGTKTAPKTAPKRIRTNTVFMTISRIAAIFVIGFSLGMLFHFYWKNNQHEQVAFIENIVPLGSKSEIKMPDGTAVWLNAGSTLRYPTDYGKTKRNVYLTGEGYFKVTRQTEKPFTVHTALAIITTLGTEFDVKAYPEENVLETTLIEGKLAVEHSEASGVFDRVLLKTGQKLSVTVTDQKPETVVTQIDQDMAEAEVSWKETNWRIESETLQHLAVKLERRYNVRITVDDRLKDIRFSATLSDESLEQVLRYMQISNPILFYIDGKNVDIRFDMERME